jgi:N-acetylmuramoyl-L-alanine amidase
MPDDNDSQRKPFGERDAEERKLPFGARPPVRPDSPYRQEPPRRPTTPEESSRHGTPAHEPDPSVDVDEAEPLTPFKPRTAPPEAQGDQRYAERASTRLEDVMRDNGGDASLFEDEDDEADIEVEDEPDHAPNLIKVRSQRRRGVTDSAILKKPPKREFQSIPAMDEAERAAQAERAAAAKRAQNVLQMRVILQSIATLFLTAGLFATLFTWWTPNTFLPAASMDRLSAALATQTAPVVEFVPTLTPLAPSPGANVGVPGSAPRIGIVSGHKGLHPSSGLPDTGAVCEDGLTEQAVVETVANQTAELLRGHGYTVEILEEFDPRLNGYSAQAIISLHADSCEYINDVATGFKVASFVNSTNPSEDSRLVGCMIARYAETTGMQFHPSVTYDMTDYHNFREVQPGTPGAILEIGFMLLDRPMLTEHPDVIALGVARGVICYLRNEPFDPNNIATPSPEP